MLNVFWSNSQTLLPKTECLGQITAPINASGRRISSETSGLFLCNSSTAVSWRKQVNNTNKQKTHINNTQPSCPFSRKLLISLVSPCQFGLSILEVCYMQNYQGKLKKKKIPSSKTKPKTRRASARNVDWTLCHLSLHIHWTEQGQYVSSSSPTVKRVCTHVGARSFATRLTGYGKLPRTLRILYTCRTSGPILS